MRLEHVFRVATPTATPGCGGCQPIERYHAKCSSHPSRRFARHSTPAGEPIFNVSPVPVTLEVYHSTRVAWGYGDGESRFEDQ